MALLKFGTLYVPYNDAAEPAASPAAPNFMPSPKAMLSVRSFFTSSTDFIGVVFFDIAAR